MTFDPAGWLDVADHACNPGHGEAWHRTAGNRAYYAALMAIARRVVEEQGAGALEGSQSTHARLKRGLREHGHIPLVRGIRDELLALEQGFRDGADYELEESYPPDRATEALRRSRKLVAKINNLSAKYFANLPV